jgi:hypothetical protein
VLARQEATYVMMRGMPARAMELHLVQIWIANGVLVGAWCPITLCLGGGWPMDRGLRVQLSEEHADAERLDELTSSLRQELLQLDVEDVTALRAGAPPPGARGLELAAVGSLLVGLGSSVDGLRSVVSAISGWLSRGWGAHRSVRLEIDGDVLELSEASTADQDRLVGLFIARHAT